MSSGVAYCAQRAAENETLAADAADPEMRKLFETLAEFWFGAAYRCQWATDLEVDLRVRSEWPDLIHYSDLIRAQNGESLEG
jgi:hypothetical protein